MSEKKEKSLQERIEMLKAPLATALAGHINEYNEVMDVIDLMLVNEQTLGREINEYKETVSKHENTITMNNSQIANLVGRLPLGQKNEETEVVEKTEKDIINEMRNIDLGGF